MDAAAAPCVALTAARTAVRSARASVRGHPPPLGVGWARADIRKGCGGVSGGSFPDSAPSHSADMRLRRVAGASPLDPGADEPTVGRGQPAGQDAPSLTWDGSPR
ncbi:hypothetical protein GCM10009575_095240 [Streptomyces rhizosphaericus]|uniref:Uncharacterized protein n=1 Tax=Streptomyces rhizosphaericus TaxID=114699 RepID=A0ABN1RPI1_9ACTN